MRSPAIRTRIMACLVFIEDSFSIIAMDIYKRTNINIMFIRSLITCHAMSIPPMPCTVLAIPATTFSNTKLKNTPDNHRIAPEIVNNAIDIPCTRPPTPSLITSPKNEWEVSGTTKRTKSIRLFHVKISLIVCKIHNQLNCIISLNLHRSKTEKEKQDLQIIKACLQQFFNVHFR